MFRSMIIIRELVLHLAKVILKQSVKLLPYVRILCGKVAACCQVQYKLPDDDHRPKHVGAMLMCILM